MSLIELENIQKTYGSRRARHGTRPDEPVVHALRGVDLRVEQGEMVAIMGKSGSGKSTLLNILGALDRMTGGSYRFDGKEVPVASPTRSAAFRRSHIGFIVQDFALIEDMTVFENVALPLRQSRTRQKEVVRRVGGILEKLGIGDKARTTPLKLSGGEQQRVAIARAVVHEPDLLLADEPTGALDEETERGILEVLHQLHRAGRTIVMVTHDQNVADECGRTIRLRDGRVETGEMEA